MPFEDTSSPPAQTHPVKFRPPSLRGLSFFAYLALAFVIISTVGVLCYAAYSFYYSLSLNAIPPLPQYSVESQSKAKRLKQPKAVRPSRSSSSQQQPMLSHQSTDHDSTDQVDFRMSLTPLAHASADRAHIPPVAFPPAAVVPAAKPHTFPMYDMHNIRFASPSNGEIYANPKLSPVQGSAVPHSYNSQTNVFGNLFTPTTTQSRKTRSDRRRVPGFRRKGKADKENQGIPLSRMY
ncbi:hypothetical protein C8R47DRAFT_44849 [Mycena vitilis]|nr:hypothetical protein C8R47DRAFT_44849 [Mycena vitilis]